ncbi:MAG: hypothetical protein V2A62_05450 [Candidatus Woesearchaeota archaeon]
MKKIYQILLSTAFITSVGFGVDYGFHKLIQNKQQECAERVAEIERKIQYAIGKEQAYIYSSEGMQFSPGGGYFFLPDGMKLSEQERKEIRDRINGKEAVLDKLQKRVDCAFHPDQKIPFYCP